MEYINLERKLCESLIQIKEQNPNEYKNVLNVLSFIYKDIRLNYFHDGVYHTDSSIGIKDLEGQLINQMTESNDGIIDNLLDMCKNPDSRFKNRFFKDIEVPIDLMRNDIFKGTKNYLYIINLYTMLQAYQYNKDNYENFEAIMEDISLLFIEDNSYFINGLNYLKEIKETINEIVNNKNYKDIKDLRIFFKKYFKHITKDFDKKEYLRLTEMFKMYREFYNNLNSMNRTTKKVSKTLEKEILDDISWLVHPDLLTGVYPYYSRILIYNNRYKNFKEKIRVVNPYYRKEVFDTIKKLNIGMFADLNKGKEEDSFEKYMDILFDSDTNSELYSKLRMLSLASEKYDSDDKAGAFLTLSSLEKDDYKSKFGDVIIAYPKNNGINKIEKPETIDKRMEELYRGNDLISEEFDISKERSSLSEFNNQIFMEMTSYSTKKFATKEEHQEEKPVVKKKSIFSGLTSKR